MVHTQAAQAEADAPPTTIAAQPLLSAMWRAAGDPCLSNDDIHLVVVVPCLSQDTREARLEKARLQKGEAVKAEGWAQGAPNFQGRMPHELSWS